MSVQKTSLGRHVEWSAADASCRVRCGSEGDDARGGVAVATMRARQCV